jgi:hypothetical protein
VLDGSRAGPEVRIEFVWGTMSFGCVCACGLCPRPNPSSHPPQSTPERVAMAPAATRPAALGSPLAQLLSSRFAFTPTPDAGTPDLASAPSAPAPALMPPVPAAVSTAAMGTGVSAATAPASAPAPKGRAVAQAERSGKKPGKTVAPRSLLVPKPDNASVATLFSSVANANKSTKGLPKSKPATIVFEDDGSASDRSAENDLLFMDVDPGRASPAPDASEYVPDMGGDADLGDLHSLLPPIIR